MFIILAVIAVVAVAVFAYKVPGAINTPTASSSIPDISLTGDDTMASDIDAVLQDIVNEESAMPDVRPQARPEPANIEPDQQGDTTSDGSEEPTTSQQAAPELNNNATLTTETITDGINKAYFAKEVFTEKGDEDEVVGNHEYEFNTDQDFGNGDSKSNVASIIYNRTKDILNANKQCAKEADIEAALTKDTYTGKKGRENGVGDKINFKTYKIIPQYEKKDNALLDDEIFIVAETTNLDEETVTITIHEKEELLVGVNEPLPVLEIPEEDENAVKNQRYTQQESRMGHDRESQDRGGRSSGNGASGSFEGPDQPQSADRAESDTNGTPPSQNEGTSTELADKQEEEEAGQENESQDAEENEITQLKAVVEEGIAKIKIKLRPKSAKELQRWVDILAGKEEETIELPPATPEEIAQAQPQTPLSYGVEGTQADENSSFGSLGTTLSFPSSLGSMAAVAQSYTVKSGDTLSAIASQHNISIQQLQTENGITNPNSISVGEQLTIPGGSGTNGGSGNTPPSLTTPERETLTPKTEFLWLKAHAVGIEEYNEEFLNEDKDKENENDSYFRIGGICECELKIRAFISMIRVKEGVVGEIGYETIVGGDSFIKDYNRDWSDHPDISVYIDRLKKNSDAAGAYQVMGDTWNSAPMLDKRRKHNINTFTPLDQDRFAVALLKYKRTSQIPEGFILRNGWGMKFREAYGDMAKMIIEDDLDKAILIASLEWASLPDSPYGQQDPNYTLEDVKELYKEYYDKEAKGESDLYLQPGFLKEFGYDCCDGAPGNWHDPVDNPMLCLYIQNGNYRPRYNVFGRVRSERDNHNHQGIDLLALPGSNVYACLDGTVVRAGDSGGGYGDVITIKVDNPQEMRNRKRSFSLKYSQEGELEKGSGFNEDGDYYIFYAHLQTVNVSMNEKVKKGDVIGLNGTSGYGETKDPHLHFEILNVPRASGLSNRVHPGFYCHYKGENDLTQDEKDYQEEIANKYWN